MTPPDDPDDAPEGTPPIDWESFYRNYRKPGYIRGFEILHKLGGGAFGLVYKARKESIGKEYAIKFLKVDDEGVRKAVLHELGSVHHFAQVDHPNLVSIEDRGEVDGIPYILMGYAGNETLATRLRDGGLPREVALRLFAQAARGLQALHSHGLVHFDLKPANVFLKGDVARLGDYGLSKLITASRNSLSFGRGTPYYMAPEMLHRRGDHRSDIYSLGVLLFECLTGDVPFRGDSEWEVLRKHEREAPVWPASLDENERAAIARCLAKDPADRFQSVGELLDALGTTVAPFATAHVAAGSAAAPRPARKPLAAAGASAPAARAATQKRRPAHWHWNRGWLAAAIVGIVLVAKARDRSSDGAVRVSIERGRQVATAISPRPAPIALGFAESPFRERASDELRRLAKIRPNKNVIQSLAGEFCDDKARRTLLIATVNRLQELDYAKASDCREAYWLGQLFQELTHVTWRVRQPRGGGNRVTRGVTRQHANEVRRLRTWVEANVLRANATVPTADCSDQNESHSR